MDTDLSAPFSEAAQSPLLIPFLLSLPGLGVVSYWQLRQHSLPLQRLMTQPLQTLLPMIPKSAREAFADVYRHGENSSVWQGFVQLHQQLFEDGVECLTHEDIRYPSLLSNISQAPPVLYVKGSIEALDRPQIAFVGSRHASQSACKTTEDFSRFLAQAGITVTSGLAAGIDGSAHKGAVDVSRPTVAVMGTGIDQVYPKRHRLLAEAIIDTGGALVSEFPPQTPPHGGNFPRRNRIISGLSLGVLVVEAALKSGSLITARYALEQNREVFAIPGSIHNPLSRGCHALIRDGATLVETAEDIARELAGWCPSDSTVAATVETPPSDSRLPDLDINEQSVWKAIEYEPCDVDELSQRVNLATSVLLAVLMQLELKGLISQKDGRVERLAL